MATKQKFTVQLNTDGSAFSEGLPIEVARILRKIADDISYNGMIEGAVLRLKDLNGNRVGFAALESYEEADAT